MSFNAQISLTTSEPASPLRSSMSTSKSTTPPRVSKIPQPRFKPGNGNGTSDNSPARSNKGNDNRWLSETGGENSSDEGYIGQDPHTKTAGMKQPAKSSFSATGSSDSLNGSRLSSSSSRTNGKLFPRNSGIPGLLTRPTPSHGGITKPAPASSHTISNHITNALASIVSGGKIKTKYDRNITGVGVPLPLQTPRKISPNYDVAMGDINSYNRSPGKTGGGYKGNRLSVRGPTSQHHNPTSIQLDNINEKFILLNGEIKKLKEKNGEEISNLHQELIRLTTEKSTSNFEMQQLRDHNSKIQEDLLLSERKYMILESEAKEAIQQRDNDIDSIKKEFLQIIKEKEQEFTQKEILSQEKWVNEKTAANEKLMDDLNDIQGNYETLLQEAKKVSDEKDERIKQLESQTVEIEKLQLAHAQALKNVSLKHHTEITNVLSKTEKQTRELQQRMDSTEQNATEQISSLNNEIEHLKETNSENQQKLLASVEEMHEFKTKKTQDIRDSFNIELSKLKQNYTSEQQKLQGQNETLTSELSKVKDLLEKSQLSLEMERKTNIALKNSLTEVSVSSASLESITASLKARIDELQIELTTKDSDSIQMRNLMVQAQQERDEAKSRLLTEETLRRKLHNQIQDLKGKFRVFCRVRPAHSNAADGEKIEVADIVYPDERADGQEIQIYGPSSESAMGNITTKVHPFSFDKVFTPRCDNEEVFLEISQLVQSALDGYNVCIFAYGQTGSGKTHTMSSHDGMIPRAVEQIFQTCEGLKEKGWKYMLEGQFLEIYNENINDLLGKPNRSEKINHEIRHDVKEQKTVVTDLTTATLDSPEKVIAILRQADNNRSVAATKSNERSSRSHSVFILKIQGKNYLTGEQCNGILNLVDLAGSERLSQSQAIGERLKETQAINKSLSCLGDVIYAMSNSREGAHIPYRNSKLTYLLQYSLSGNSKTLMFVNVSPLKQHANETINSLRFATKVNNTQITSVRTVRGMSPTKN